MARIHQIPIILTSSLISLKTRKSSPTLKLHKKQLFFYLILSKSVPHLPCALAQFAWFLIPTITLCVAKDTKSEKQSVYTPTHQAKKRINRNTHTPKSRKLSQTPSTCIKVHGDAGQHGKERPYKFSLFPDSLPISLILTHPQKRPFSQAFKSRQCGFSDLSP